MMIFWILIFLLGFTFPPDSHAAGDTLAEVDGVAILKRIDGLHEIGFQSTRGHIVRTIDDDGFGRC